MRDDIYRKIDLALLNLRFRGLICVLHSKNQILAIVQDDWLKPLVPQPDRPTPNFRYTKAITTEDSATPQTDIPPTIRTFTY
jgi:hypothetical protein